MKRFFAFVKKEFYHIFRDVRTVMILLLMPIAQILLFGFALSAEVKNIQVAVLDNSQDQTTRKIIERFNGNEYFNIARDINSISELDTVFDDDTISLVLVFQNDFEKNLIRNGKADLALMIDASDPNKASTVNLYAMNVISSASADLTRELQASGKTTSLQIMPEIKMLYNPQGKSAYNFAPGLMGMVMMLICAMMTSISIVREKETGSMEVLLTSPLKPFAIILAKITPYFFISCLSLAGILITCVVALGMEIKGSLLIVVGFSMLYIILSLSIGILISSITKTQVTAMLISGMVFMMPIMMLSGMMFPIESMPVILQWISNIIPAKWFIIGIKKVMIEGLGLAYIKKELIIIFCMTVIAIAVSLKKFKNRLE